MNAMNDHHAYIVLSLYLRNVDIVLYWFLLVICGQYSLSQYTRIRRWHSICCNVSNVECSIFLTLSSTPSIDSNVFFSSTLSNYHLLCTFKKVLSVTASPCANKSGKEENTNTKASNMKQHGWQNTSDRSNRLDKMDDKLVSVEAPSNCFVDRVHHTILFYTQVLYTY